ncbi:MAG: GEVED domain-containing protein, partial [Candidatus Kapabacteria bacterium]|nr:GEVED domain-containing protein [Candidatus Kapabacteria bacterium]
MMNDYIPLSTRLGTRLKTREPMEEPGQTKTKVTRWLGLLSLCIMFFVGQIGFAQTVTIGSGTSTVTTLPITSCWDYSYTQQIYTAAQIGQSGNIEKIRFYYNTGGDAIANWNQWDVYIGHTSKTSFSSLTDWEPVGNLTQVFSGTITPVAGDWFDLDFTSVFAYNGTGNLVIAVHEKSSGYSCSAAFRSFTSGTNTGIHFRRDTTPIDPASPPSATARLATIPQIQIVLQPTVPPNCATSLLPADAAIGVVKNPALTWTDGGGAQSYDVYFGTSANPGFVANVTSASYSPVAPLASNTTYYWKVVPKNLNGDATGCTEQSFTTGTGFNYCASNPTNGADTKISSLTLGGDTRAGATGTTTYTDRTADTPLTIQKEASTFFSLTAGSASASQYAAYSKVFIDLNQDGDFDDEGELVFEASHPATPVASRTQTGDLLIPATALLGNTRMRVVLRESGTTANTEACGTYGYGETQDYTITILEAPSCLPPSGLTATNLTGNSANLGWTSDGDDFDIKWGIPGFDVETEGTLVEDFANGGTLSGLDPLTAYQYYVRQDCGVDGLSTWAGPFNFTTTQILGTLPYAEGFEGVVNWSFVNGTQVNKWHIGTAVNNGGSNALYVSNDNGVTNAYTINSASVTQVYRDIAVISGTGVVSFSFNWKGMGENTDIAYDYFRVWLVPTSFNPTAGTQITSGSGRVQVGGNFYRQSAWQTYSNPTLDLSAFAGTTMRLVFEWRNDFGGGTGESAAIDNISISVPDCPAPTALTATDITANSAVLGWTSGGSDFDIKYGAPGFDVETAGVLVEGFANGGTLSGLDAATTYQFYVRQDCGNDETSDWAGPFGFTTLCPAAVTDLPYAENFDTYGTGSNAFPNCWERPVTYDSGTVWPSIVAVSGNSSPNSLRFQSLTTTPIYAVSPAFAEDINNLRVRFQLRREGASSGTIDIGVMSDPFDLNTFELVQTIDPVDDNFNGYVFNLDETVLAGGNNHVAFRHNSGSSAWYYWLDDFVVELIPSCLEPTDLTATNITANGVDLGWTSDGDTFDIKYGTPGFDVETEGNLVTEVSNPHPQTISVGGNYQFYVRQNCGAGDESIWAGPFSFRIPVAGEDCADPIVISSLPYLTTDDTANYTDNPNIEGSPGAGCGSTSSYLNGNDVVYSYTSDFDGIITVKMTPTGAWSGIFAYADCADIGTNCIGGVADSGSAERRFELNVENGETYYFVISTWASPQTVAYTLDITKLLCLAPTAGTSTGVTHNSAVLGWTSAGDDFEVNWGTGTFAAGAGDNTDIVSGTSHSLSGVLTQTTTYRFFVRQNCGVDGYSEWAGPYTFTTVVAPASIPWTEGFAETTLPLGWSNSGYTVVAATATTGSPATAKFSDTETNLIRRNPWSSSSTGNFSTISVGTVGADDALSFKYKLVNWSNDNPPALNSGKFAVEISANGGAYTLLEEVMNNGVAGWHTKTYSLSAYVGQTVRVRITDTWSSGDYLIGFDDFFIGVPPPSIVSFTPSEVCGYGDTITVTGSSFASVTDVKIGDNSVAFNIIDTNTITFEVPEWALSGSTISAISEHGTGVSSETLVIKPFPIVNPITGVDTFCFSSDANSFALEVAGAIGNDWSSSDENIATVNGDGLVTVHSAGEVTISFSVTDNGCTTTVSHDVVISEETAIASQTLSQTVVTGNIATFSVNATGTISGYQWYYNGGAGDVAISDGPGAYGETFSGSNTATLTISNTPEDMNWFEFFVVISNSGLCDDVYSENAILLVGDTGIETDPASVTMCSTVSNEAQFTVVASGEVDSYYWELDQTEDGWWEEISDGTSFGLTFSGSDTDVLYVTGITAAHNGWRFRVVVNGPANSAESNVAILSVTEGISISSQPQSASVCLDPAGTQNFSVVASGGIAGYIWQYSADGVSFANVANNTPAGVTYGGQDSSVLSVTRSASTPVGNHYYRVVIGADAPCGAATSETAIMNVSTPNIAITASADAYCSPGAEAVVLTASGGVSYTWSPADGLSSTTGSVVSATPSVTTVYTVTGTDANGCISTATVTVGVGNAVTATASSDLTEVCADGNVILFAGDDIPKNIADYSFTVSNETYVPLTGATTFSINGGSGSIDDGYSALLNIGFTFNFGGTNFTQFRVNSNGGVLLGTTTSTSTTPFNVVNNVIAFNSRDLNNTGAVYSYKLEGTAPNRIMKIQAADFYRYGTATHTGNAQVWLYEGSNKVEIRYGAYTTTWTSGNVQVGLRGASSDAANVLAVTSATWAGITNSSVTNGISTTVNRIVQGTTNQVANGTMFTFAPPSVSYSWTSEPAGFTSTEKNPVVNPSATTTYTVVVTDTASGCNDAA